MSERPTIAALRAWLKSCPLIAEEQESTGAAFRIAGLDEDATAFSIEDSPGDPVITEYFSGRNMAKNYLFLSRREYGEADVLAMREALPVPRPPLPAMSRASASLRSSTTSLQPQADLPRIFPRSARNGDFLCRENSSPRGSTGARPNERSQKMVICGQEFNFSVLNANDMDRFEDANERMQQAGRAEKERFNRGGVRLGDHMRAQARLVMACIDEILGAGASARLGLDENDAAPIYDVLDAINEACMAEKQRYTSRIPKPQPMNREQRRAEKKHKHGQKPQAVSFPAQPPAARMVERVDKAARRKALLAELAALDD